MVDNHQGFLAGKEEPWLGSGEAQGAQGGRGGAGQVPVLGPEKRLLVGLSPDELVSPAYERNRRHTHTLRQSLTSGAEDPGSESCPCPLLPERAWKKPAARGL